jgi:hypothetical protein
MESQFDNGESIVTHYDAIGGLWMYSEMKLEPDENFSCCPMVPWNACGP